MSLFHPEGQKRLTNISVVKLRKNGHRFELACYPNKVKSWRDRIETDLDQVLQCRIIFQNVHKGEFANKKEIADSFSGLTQDQIIEYILINGEIQKTERERHAEVQALFKDVATIIADKCINPENNRQYTVSMIEKMIHDCHINLRINKTAKQQALSVIKELRSNDNFKIAPACVEINLNIDKKVLNQVFDKLRTYLCHVIREDLDQGPLYEIIAVIEPENYHKLIKLLNDEIKGRYAIEILGKTRLTKKQFVNPISHSHYSSSPILKNQEYLKSVDSHSSVQGSDETEKDSDLLICKTKKKHKKISQKKSSIHSDDSD